jgi:hypothetical protein
MNHLLLSYLLAAAIPALLAATHLLERHVKAKAKSKA